MPLNVKPILYCLNCNNLMKYRYSCFNKFCNSKCKGEYVFKQSLKRFEEGLIHDRPLLRKILTLKSGYKCCKCTISNWNNKPITLQVNHIDGNCTNNYPVNLELICPNCHSQTDTFGAKNKGSGRKARGVALHF